MMLCSHYIKILGDLDGAKELEKVFRQKLMIGGLCLMTFEYLPTLVYNYILKLGAPIHATIFAIFLFVNHGLVFLIFLLNEIKQNL